MSISLQIYVDTSNEKYLTEKIERGELYILCRENVDDYEGLYCKNGKIHPHNKGRCSQWKLNMATIEPKS